MPRQVELEGKDPAELVYVHLKLPLWLKRRAAKKAENAGQALTAYVIAVLVADLGARK